MEAAFLNPVQAGRADLSLARVCLMTWPSQERFTSMSVHVRTEYWDLPLIKECSGLWPSMRASSPFVLIERCGIFVSVERMARPPALNEGCALDLFCSFPLFACIFQD